MKGWELVTPAERRLAVLLFALAVLGQFARWGGRASPEVARWLEGGPSPAASPETISVSKDVLPAMPSAPRPDTAVAMKPPPSSEPNSGAAGDVDPNTADRTALMRLPGVGPVLADRILADRARSGPYGRPEDLLRVPGIGPAKLAKLRAHLVFGRVPGG